MRRAKPPLEAQDMFRSASRASDDTTRAQRGALRPPGELVASKRMGGGDPITSGDSGLGAFVPVTSTAPQARPSRRSAHPAGVRNPKNATRLGRHGAAVGDKPKGVARIRAQGPGRQTHDRRLAGRLRDQLEKNIQTIRSELVWRFNSATEVAYRLI